MLMEFNEHTKFIYIEAVISILRRKGYSEEKLMHYRALMQKDTDFLADQFNLHCHLKEIKERLKEELL
jgi:hypothetical protein